MGDGRSLFDDLPTMDVKKATRLIVYGLLLAIIFAAVAMISINLSNMSGTLWTLLNHERQMNYNLGLITYEDYLRIGEENLHIQYILAAQVIFILPIARVGGFIAAFMVALGFLSLGMNTTVEEKARKIYLIIGAIVTFLLVMSVLGMTISAEIS